jgi:hypothetical protein
MQKWHLVVSRGPELENNAPDHAQTAAFHGVLENMENAVSGVSLLESGAAYRNRTDT